jgi:hypothetical protein
MASIQADAAGLTALAAHCEAHAAQLASTSTPGVPAGGFQPSVAAVEAAHADVAAAGVQLTARMHSTATAASAAADEYVNSDHASAADIASVTTGLTGV